MSGTTVDYDRVVSLSALLANRGHDLNAISFQVRSGSGLADPDVGAGLGFVQQVWGQAVGLLGADLDLTGRKVDSAVVAYEQVDRTVGAAVASSEGTAGPGQARAE